VRVEVRRLGASRKERTKRPKTRSTHREEWQRERLKKVSDKDRSVANVEGKQYPIKGKRKEMNRSGQPEANLRLHIRGIYLIREKKDLFKDYDEREWDKGNTRQDHCVSYRFAPLLSETLRFLAERKA
jgi:hypothetical protein